MKCDKCDLEAVIFLVDKDLLKLPERITPGMFIECKNPSSVEKYCNEHFEAKLKREPKCDYFG